MQGLPHGDVGEHHGPAPLRCQDQHVGGSLPLDTLLRGFGQRGDIVPSIVKRLRHATVRHGNRIVEGARPSHQVVRDAMLSVSCGSLLHTEIGHDWHFRDGP